MSFAPEKKVLVLQGGGALGSYQAGAFEALFAGGRDVATTLNHPDWHTRHNDSGHIRVFDLTKIETR